MPLFIPHERLVRQTARLLAEDGSQHRVAESAERAGKATHFSSEWRVNDHQGAHTCCVSGGPLHGNGREKALRHQGEGLAEAHGGVVEELAQRLEVAFGRIVEHRARIGVYLLAEAPPDGPRKEGRQWLDSMDKWLAPPLITCPG